MKSRTALILPFLCSILIVDLGYSQQSGVEVKPSRRGDRVEITVNGKPFTTYMNSINTLDIGKPVFAPVYDSNGTIVTRGYPLVQGIEGENEDHPHHTGAFFTYGDISAGWVKSLDFWASRSKGERIRTTKIRDFQSGADFGSLTTVALWEAPQTGPILEQTQKATFRYDPNSRIIDYDITLEALDVPVTFEDTKEGGLGLRYHYGLTEKNGGSYLNAEGLETEKNVWGKRSKWIALSGKIEGEPVVIAMFYHPEAINSPPYWHARGYGLFTVNPFGGRRAFSGNKEEPSITRIEPGESIDIKYRLFIYSGELTQSQLEQKFDDYVRQYAD